MIDDAFCELEPLVRTLGACVAVGRPRASQQAGPGRGRTEESLRSCLKVLDGFRSQPDDDGLAWIVVQSLTPSRASRHWRDLEASRTPARPAHHLARLRPFTDSGE